MIDNPDSIFPPARKPEPPPPSSNPHPPTAPPPWKGLPSRNPKTVLIAVIAAASGFICLCGVAFALLFAFIWNENGDLAMVVDHYMTAMAHQDAHTAYNLLSSRARQEVTLEDLKLEMRNSRYINYSGYQSTEVNSTSISAATDDRQELDLTQGEIEGNITYTGGTTIGFRATLDKEDGVWKLYIIEALRTPGIDS
jgi:hypothetical protein